MLQHCCHDDKVKKLTLMDGWFMVFNATSIIFQLYCGGQFYWWRKPEYQKKTTDMSQVIDTLDYIMLYRATIMDKITGHLYFVSLKYHEKRTNLSHYFHYKMI